MQKASENDSNMSAHWENVLARKGLPPIDEQDAWGNPLVLQETIETAREVLPQAIPAEIAKVTIHECMRQNIVPRQLGSPTFERFESLLKMNLATPIPAVVSLESLDDETLSVAHIKEYDTVTELIIGEQDV